MRLTILALCFLAPSLAVAEGAKSPAPIVVDFSQVLKGPDGKVLPSGDCARDEADKAGVKTCVEYRPLTLGDAACVALEATFDEERKEDGTAKFPRDQLCRKIYGEKSVQLSPDDAHEIKTRIRKAFSAAVVGAAWPLLDATLKN